MKDANGEIKTEDEDKAEIVNNFFTSVFTVEGDSELPDFEPKVNEKNNIDTCIINIKQEKLLEQLKNLIMCRNPVALITVIHLS